MKEPLISLTLEHPRRGYRQGELMVCEYQVDAVEPEAISAVESSVLWHTEGKGDEDIGVHHFERRTAADHGDLRQFRRVEIVLPNSPLSYRGKIVSIRWCVRIRVFLRGGKEHVAERAFDLTSSATTLAEKPSLVASA